jgi:serine protease AprX
MNNQRNRIVLALIILGSLMAISLWPALAQEAREVGGEPVFLKLKYATFDPLQGEPVMPAELQVSSYADGGEGAYIVQFRGPVEEGWKDAVRALGGRVMDYLPDYAFLVWMDGATKAEVTGLEAVRWVGLYQPAYKLSPNLDRDRPLYRVVLFEGADLAAVASRLGGLDTPTTGVPGEQFTLLLPGGNVEAVAAWPEVFWIENRPFYQVDNNVAAGIMNAPAAWASSLNGSGMTVTAADTGVDSGVDGGTMHADFQNRMAHISSWPVIDDGCGGCCWNIGADDGAADLDSGHGSHVLGSVGGNGSESGGTFKGLAYQASLTFQAVEQYVDFTTLCEGAGFTDGYYLLGIPDDIKQLFAQAYGWGSRVHTNSWGSAVEGEYTVDSQAVDTFVWNNPQMIILYSAGNEGTDANANGYVDEDSIGSPGSAKNCITGGASENERTTGGYSSYTWGTAWPTDFPAAPTGTDRISSSREHMAAFSSRGPTDDGRRKPDLVAPGTDVVSVRSQYASGTLWGVYNQYYVYSGGTSMSTPLIAGAATLMREYYVEGESHTPSAALVKATLINSAVDISGYGNASQEAGQPIPNNHEGWGRVDVGAATSGQREFVDGDTVGTGGSKTYTYDIGLTTTPLKVTLVWSDYPGSPPSGGLVNNLNLVVTGPGGTTYRGNYFSGGWSVPGGTADSVNNVESVYVQSPGVGQWTVRVDGVNVPQGPQPFALVVTGYFGPPLVFDHTAYLPLVLKNVGVAPVPPAAPTLNPIDNADGDGNYTVSWTASAGATNYLLQEDDNAAFSSPVTAFSGAATSTAISGKPVGTYYYRVRAANVYGVSAWSNIRSVVVASAPAAPTLNPINNADGDGNYTVSWTASAGATNYLLQEDDNAAFSSPVTAYSGAATSTAISGKPNGTYYYRVRASNASGDSAWSNTQSVTVSLPSGPEPGFWEEVPIAYSEFYVTADRAYVDDFAIYIYVSGCGSYKITHMPPEPIVSNHFSWGVTYYASGTFSTSTQCSGIYGLDNFYIPGCGYVSGGPFSYTSEWQHASLGAGAGTGAGGDGMVAVEPVDPDAVPFFQTVTVDSEPR